MKTVLKYAADPDTVAQCSPQLTNGEAQQYGGVHTYVAQAMLDVFTPGTATVAQKLRLWVEHDPFSGGSIHALPQAECLIADAQAISLSFVLVTGNWASVNVKADVIDLDTGDTYQITLFVVEV